MPPFTVLLDTVGEGVKLTAAGYLPPAVVEKIIDELDMADDAVGDRRPIDRRTATGLIATDVHLLRQLGAFERDLRGGWPGPVTTDGIALARAALAGPTG